MTTTRLRKPCSFGIASFTSPDSFPYPPLLPQSLKLFWFYDLRAIYPWMLHHHSYGMDTVGLREKRMTEHISDVLGPRFALQWESLPGRGKPRGFMTFVIPSLYVHYNGGTRLVKMYRRNFRFCLHTWGTFLFSLHTTTCHLLREFVQKLAHVFRNSEVPLPLSVRMFNKDLQF